MTSSKWNLRLAIKRNVSRTLLFHSVIFPSDLWLLTSCQYKVIGIGIKFQMKKKENAIVCRSKKKVSWIQNSKWRAHIFRSSYAMWVLLSKWMNHLNAILIKINIMTSNAGEAQWFLHLRIVLFLRIEIIHRFNDMDKLDFIMIVNAE